MVSAVKYIFLSLLLALLVLPGLGFIHKIKSYDNYEKRTLAIAPRFELSKKFVVEMEAYFKDHALFRHRLSHLSASYKYNFFKSSAKPGVVLIGKDDWLYYSSKDDKLIASLSRTDLFSNKELKDKVVGWTIRKQNLLQANKEYYVAFWPNKSTVYTEYLPLKLKLLKKDTLSKLDQIMNYSSQDSSLIQPLDMRSILIKQKEARLLYHKYDSHWNNHGAFLAYQALMRKMGIKPYQLDDLDLKMTANHKGDLLALIGLGNSTKSEEQFELISNVQKISLESSPTYFYNPDAPIDQTIVVFRDSYFSALIPFIMLHFKKGYFPKGYYNQDFVNEYDPKIIISANVERRI